MGEDEACIKELFRGGINNSPLDSDGKNGTNVCTLGVILMEEG